MKWSRVLINILNVRSSFPTFRLSIGNFFHILPTTWKPARYLPPSKLFPDFWLWNDTKNEETITYETAQTSALSWLKMLEYFGKYKTNSPLLTGKRSSTPLAFFIDFGFVSALEEWAGSGSAGLPLTHVDCSTIL